MAVLFDSFSYRIKEVESGICYDTEVSQVNKYQLACL